MSEKLKFQKIFILKDLNQEGQLTQRSFEGIEFCLAWLRLKLNTKIGLHLMPRKLDTE